MTNLLEAIPILIDKINQFLSWLGIPAWFVLAFALSFICALCLIALKRTPPKK